MERKINISIVIATLAIVLAIGVAIFKGGTETIVREVPQQFGVLAGTRYPHGIGVGGNTLPTDNGFLLQATSTCNGYQNGNFCYEKRGVAGSEGITAYGSFNSTATSGAPVIIPYPFGAGTRSLSRGSCSGTSLSAGTNFLTISTTTGMATSTPAFVYSKTLAASQAFYTAWFPRMGTSTNYGTLLLDNDELMPFKATDSMGTTTYYVRFPGQSIIAKWASSSPGTFGGGYASFTCYTQDTLI